MCCTCGRFLPQEDFDLEHLIPQQALKIDPITVRNNPETPKNVRAGNLLLCRKPLKYRNNVVYKNGCNSWKGRFYDGAIADLLSGNALKKQRKGQGHHIVAALSLGYLAMVSEFGYQVALTQSGLLLRQQFFHPSGLLKTLPIQSQMLVVGASDGIPPGAPMWAKPFSFDFEAGLCNVKVRTFGIMIPTTRDPRIPLAKHLAFVPEKYRLRPNFVMAFD